MIILCSEAECGACIHLCVRCIHVSQHTTGSNGDGTDLGCYIPPQQRFERGSVVAQYLTECETLPQLLPIQVPPTQAATSPGADPTGRAGVLRPDLPEAMQAAGMDRSSALYKAVVRIQSRYRGYVIRKVRCASTTCTYRTQCTQSTPGEVHTYAAHTPLRMYAHAHHHAHVTHALPFKNLYSRPGLHNIPAGWHTE